MSPRKTRKLLETEQYSRNLIKEINTWAFHFVRYLGSFSKGTKEELRQMDQRTRKLRAMSKALHPSDDVDWLCVSRYKGGRGLVSIEDSVDVSIQWFEDYIKKRRGRLITVTRNNIYHMLGITHLFPHNELVHLPYIAVAINTRAD